MKANDYVELEKKHLDKFLAMWNAHHDQDPKDFPEDLDESEWKEQYEIFIDSII